MITSISAGGTTPVRSYQDETAVRLINEIDYDFSDADKNARSLMQRFGSLEVAMRQNDLAWLICAYVNILFFRPIPEWISYPSV